MLESSESVSLVYGRYKILTTKIQYEQIGWSSTVYSNSM